MAGPAVTPDLYTFLEGAELAHYYDGLRRDLKVTSVPQLKYVDDDDLSDLGMTRPEMRRLKKFYRRECPQGTFSKLRKMLKGTDASSPPPGPDKPSGPPVSTAPGKHVIPEEAITVLKTLGTGEFGTVQQGVWTTDAGQRVQVAIKRLLKEKLQSGMPDFLSEATIMHSLDHEHVVRLYGVVIGADALMLVTELAPLRSLLECLREPSFRPSFPVTQLCEVSRQVAAGMAYLEDNRFIHRDLAARNILVFRKDTVKISDFGLSRALGVGKDYYQTNFNVNLKLPLAWCAPECINFLRFTSASDVWAYGVTLWELFSYGFQPWAGFTGHQVHQAIDEPSCQRLEQPDLCPTPYYQLMTNCWQHQADKRPKFADIVTQLPLIKPDQVQVIRDTPTSPAKDHLPLRATDIVTVLDKSCPDVPSPGMWKGVNNDGKVGYFDRVNVAPFIDVKTSPAHRKAKITRKESGRKSSRSLKPKLQPKIQPKLHVGLIGRPEGDLRHTGHIGYDGAMFGDVAFIGEQYEKLPVKVGTPTHMNNAGSASSLSNIGDGDNYSQADSLMTSSMISVESHDDTLTDVSSMCDLDAVSVSRSQETLDRYEEINDDDLDNFRVPDLGLGADLDLGPSFLEEVMKALSTKESPSAHSKPINETSPLIERDQPFRHGRTTFDNVAMVTENDSNGTTDTDNQDSGDVKSSLMSPESDGREAEAGQKDEKKRKNKLKLFIPNRDKKERMRTLSASDEKRIDDAIELANEFAQMQTSDHMVSSPRASLASAEPDTGSPQTARASSGFMSLRKSKSPKVEKKSFTEEMASMASSENLLTPEAQEAYNLLVVKGSLKEKVGKDRRQRRSLDQESSRRPVNQNIRDPQGIPGRVASPRGEEQDTNPLRRLRDSAFIPKSRLPKSAGSGDSNGWGSRKQSKTEDPELNANLSFFAKLKEQETEVATATSPTTNGTSNGVTNGELIVDVSVSSNNSVCGTSSSPQLPTPPRSKHGTNRILPVPPRVPLKPSTLNQKPRQRKYPLDLSSYSHHLPVSSTSSAGDRGSYSSDGSSGLGTSPRGTTDALNTTHESDDSVFNHTDSSRNVTLSASDLGYYDTTDTFWSKTVDFDELSAGRDPSVSREASPIPGRYKTSDNVSYEDLMEFALDGPIIPTREPDDPICDEVRLMRRILSKEVTTESCMYALEETRWDVHAAVKLLKLKQLLGADLGDSAACKRALMAAHWSVEEAANYLLKHPPNQTSPDLVHV